VTLPYCKKDLFRLNEPKKTRRFARICGLQERHSDEAPLRFSDEITKPKPTLSHHLSMGAPDVTGVSTCRTLSFRVISLPQQQRNVKLPWQVVPLLPSDRLLNPVRTECERRFHMCGATIPMVRYDYGLSRRGRLQR
jgi:hypothetical protein